MKLIKGRKGGTLRACRKGRPSKQTGRPKKTVTTFTSAHGGYTIHDIKVVIVFMFTMHPDELKQIPKLPHATILEITVARALLNGLKRSVLYNLETLLSRVFGKPKETIETPELNDVTVTLNIGL